MEEENFEKKKSSKKGLKIAILIIVLLAIAGVVTWFVLNKVNSKPEKVFDKAVEQMFEGTDKIKEYKTATVEMDISASIKEMNNGNMDAELKSQISMVNLFLQSLKLNTKMGVDMENKVLNWQVSADYMGDKLISLDTIVQDSKIYFYLEDLYSKYNAVRLTIQSGGTLNGMFVRNKLIDFVNIVIAPIIVGGKNVATLVDGESITDESELNKLLPLQLLECNKLEHSYIELKYKVL